MTTKEKLAKVKQMLSELQKLASDSDSEPLYHRKALDIAKESLVKVKKNYEFFVECER